MAIHGALHNLGGSRETLASSLRSRRGSLMANHRISLHRASIDHYRKPIGLRSNSVDGCFVSREKEVDQLQLPRGIAERRLTAGYLLRDSSTILEERSSQLANWEKHPDADSGKAESDGENHDPTELPSDHPDAPLDPSVHLLIAVREGETHGGKISFV